MAFGFGMGFRFGSRQGGGGGQTAITPANADAFLASLGLTQAGTGTTWGETGQAATPLYEVAAGKVPLGYDAELGVFGPIVNPAGTNLALRDRDATQTAWVKTGCTAALATGDLIQDADWRGSQLITGGEFLAGDGTGWSERVLGAGVAPIYAVGSVTLERVGGDQTPLYQDFATVVGRFYLLEVDLSGDVGFTVGGTDFSPVEVNARNKTTNQSVIFQATATSRRISIFDEGTAGTAVFTRVSVQEVSAHTLITATANNATCLQSITSTSGERVSKFWVQTEDEDVFVSHGTPTGAAPYEDAFGSDTSGDWAFGLNRVNGTKAVSGGSLVYTGGASDGPYPRIVIPVSLTAGKLYKLQGALDGTAPSVNLQITSNSNGSSLGAAFQITAEGSATGSFVFVAQQSTMYVTLQLNSATPSGLTAVLDDVSIYEVAETELTPTANPVPVDLTAATFANPQLGIRLANNGDSVRLYGVQHQVSSHPLRPYIGPTSSSTVTTGARTMICTLSESPSLVSLKLRFRTPTVNVAGQTVFSVDNNAATNLIDLKANGSGGFVLRKVIASSETAFSPFAVAVNTLVQVDIEISASVFRYRIDGGSWVDGTAGIPGSLSRFRIGHDNANAGQLGQPVLALDEMSTAAMMTGDRGWNKESLI